MTGIELVVSRLEDIFTYTELSKLRGRVKIPVGYFQGVEPIIFRELYTEEQRESSLTDPKGIEGDEISLGGMLDISILADSRVGMGYLEETKFLIHRVRQVRGVERRLRGRLRRIYPYMLEVSTAAFDVGGYYKCERHYIGKGMNDGGLWVNATNGRSGMDMEWFNLLAEGSFWLQVRRESSWSVVLAPDLGDGRVSSSVLLPTDPTGIRELLRERDKGEGRSRRSALLHWVKGHYRRRRVDEGDLVRVREHMRGGLEFSWYGFKGKIVPTIEERELLVERESRKGREIEFGYRAEG